jgi:type IV pilus assembly protein PilY1
MPKKLLPNIFKQSVGSPADQTPYGMDGSPMVWSQNGGDRKIIGDAGDTLLLVTGMRRGGDSYYFLNITDPEKPELHWEITGGDTGFERLGETWATPVAARVILSGDTSLTDVLIFSGGYDSATQDPLTAHKTTADTVGHDIFMVDPLTKTLVWSASTANATAGYIPNKADMKHSIPGSVAVIDVNGDGLTDQFYAADVGGNVWRFDVNHKPGSNSKLVSGGRIGKFGGDGPSGHRQFFTKPDLAMTIRGHKAVVTVALGSGSMPSPLRADVTDRFYVLIQEIDKPTSYTTLSHSSLTNRTTLSGTTNSAGWYMDFPPGPGEKLLTPSITLANTAIFTTYLPPPAGVTDCDGETTARLWAISLLDGKAVPGIFSGTGAVGSRGELMTHFAGMLPKMDLVISDNGPVLLAGPRRLFLDKDFGLKEHTWQRQIWSRE